MPFLHEYPLRIPVLLWEELRKLAKENNRSINQEIVHRLRKSVEGYSR